MLSFKRSGTALPMIFELKAYRSRSIPTVWTTRSVQALPRSLPKTIDLAKVLAGTPKLNRNDLFVRLYPSSLAPFAVILASFLIAATTASASAAPRVSSAEKAVDLAKRDFPRLIAPFPNDSIDTSEPDTPTASASPPSDPCAAVRPGTDAELGQDWAPLIAHIKVSCEVGKGIEDEPDPVTATIATLKPGAAHFAGVPAIEIRMYESAWGSDYQYILDAPYAKVARRLKTAVLARHRENYDIHADVDLNDLFEPIPDSKGFLLRSESGGIWVHPDADDPKRTMYASTFAE